MFGPPDPMKERSVMLAFGIMLVVVPGCYLATTSRGVNVDKEGFQMSSYTSGKSDYHSVLRKHAISKRAVPVAAALTTAKVKAAVVEKGIEVAGKLVDKQLQIIDEAQQKAEDFLKKEIKLDIVPDKGWKSEDMFVPAGYHINSELSENEATPKEVGETPYSYPAGIGGVIMNGCWGTGYTDTDPCYEAKRNITACLNMIDGAAFIGTGFDGRGEYSPDSRKMSIIQRNCASKSTYDDLDVPDTMNVHGIYQTSATMHTFEGRSEFQSYLQQKAGVSGSYFGLYAGAKMAWGGSEVESSQQYMSLLEVNVDRYEVFKDEVKPQDLSPTFLREFMDLPTSYFGLGTPLKYQDFLQRWGTHYIKSGTFGGQLQIRKLMAQSEVQSKKEFAVEMEMEYKTLFSSVGAKSSTSGGVSEREQTKTTSTSLVVQGGSQEIASILSDVYSPTFKNEFKAWLQSIPQYPKAFQFQIAYITDLLNFRAHDLFPEQEMNWGCEAHFATLITETGENGEQLKYYETVDDQGNRTKHYCDFDSRQSLEDAIKRRRSSLSRAIQVYMEEGPISISDVELPTCTPSSDQPEQQDFWKVQKVPSWKEITKNKTVMKVVFDMKKDLIGNNDDIITRNMSRMVRFRYGRWVTSGEDGIFHMYNAFPKEKQTVNSKAHKLSILGLWLTYNEADGTLSLLPDDFPLSKEAFPGIASRIPGVPVASVVSEEAAIASDALQRQNTAQGDGPCNVQWSNALRFDPTDREGKCLHFTAASSGPIFVAFSTLPKDVSTWYYVKITQQKVEIFKGDTLRTSTTNTNARALGNPSLLQSYFVCLSETDTSTLIEYGKTQGGPESGEIYLNMIDVVDNSHVRFYAFGNGVQPVKVLDAHIVARQLTVARCKGDTYQDPETNLCAQRCHADCEPTAGCQTETSGSPLPQECNECRVGYDPVAQRCVASCPEGTELDTGKKLCTQSFEIIVRPDTTSANIAIRDFPTLNEWSVCMWVKLAHAFNFNSMKPIKILSYRGPADTDADSYEINIVPEDRTTLYFTVRLSTSGLLRMEFNRLSDRTWQHLCTTWSGLTGVSIQYLNGEREATGTSFVGSFPGGGIAHMATGAPQVMLLTEFNLWNRILTAEEIESFSGTCEGAAGNVKTWQEFFKYVNDKSERYNNPSSCETS